MTDSDKSMKKAKNTRKYGLARVFIFPSAGKFTAVCLDLDLIEEADTKSEALAQIKEAVSGYLANAAKNNLDDSVLNRPAPKKYWNLYRRYLDLIGGESKKTASMPDKFKSSCFYSFPISSYAESRDLCLT